jgi:antitoxin (DNA-binding transcriptional repressor) of toxin-antitoxin stability system
MTEISIHEAESRLAELTQRVGQGESFVVTRDGLPVMDLVPHTPRKGLNFGAIDAFKKKYGLTQLVTYIAPDFDDPLPEDFLIRPLPDDA